MKTAVSKDLTPIMTYYDVAPANSLRHHSGSLLTPFHTPVSHNSIGLRYRGTYPL